MVQFFMSPIFIVSGQILNLLSFPIQNGLSINGLGNVTLVGDIIPVPFGYYASIGDVLQAFGLALCIFWIVNTHVSKLHRLYVAPSAC